MTPQSRAALAGAIAVDLFDDDLEKRQKNKCDAEKATVDLSRLILNSVRRVEEACVGRRKLACDVACQEKSLSEYEKKSAYDCSPAALEDIRKADLAEKAGQKAERDVQLACMDVIATNTFSDLPHDREYKKKAELCNANPNVCKEVREALKDQKLPPDLTCGG